jgi:hypothetical protein
MYEAAQDGMIVIWKRGPGQGSAIIIIIVFHLRRVGELQRHVQRPFRSDSSGGIGKWQSRINDNAMAKGRRCGNFPDGFHNAIGQSGQGSTVSNRWRCCWRKTSGNFCYQALTHLPLLCTLCIRIMGSAAARRCLRFEPKRCATFKLRAGSSIHAEAQTHTHTIRSLSLYELLFVDTAPFFSLNDCIPLDGVVHEKRF